MDKLRECPFCGGEALARYDEEDRPYIVCTVCKAAIGIVGFFDCLTEAEAITAWNRRAQPENEPLTLDELRGMFEPRWMLHNPGTYLAYGEYGKTWLAYRTKPAETEGAE